MHESQRLNDFTVDANGLVLSSLIRPSSSYFEM